MNQTGRFFTKKEYKTGIPPQVNVDVLKKINEDPNITSDCMVFSFWFISNEKSKLEALIKYFRTNIQDHRILKLRPYDEIWEIKGESRPIQFDIESINEWERQLWDIGYTFDCKLDGWETT